MKKIAIIGGGASGMFASIMLADKGYEPVVFEKNDKLGRKLFITGKGRCNLTNESDIDVHFRNIVSNSKFLYSAYYNFDSYKTIDFFRELGVRLKTERGNRVFPESDHSSDIILALKRAMEARNVDIQLSCEVKDIICEECDEDEYEKKIKGITIKNSDGKIINYDVEDVVVATGGLSYPLTGSTGDGYRWAKELGIEVVKPEPSLVPLAVKEDFCSELMGLSLKNIEVSFVTKVKNKIRTVYKDFGEMLFTHFGVSGPVILSASAYVSKYIENGLKLYIDFKPALTEEQLDERVLRDFLANKNKQFRNSLGDLLPKSMIPVIIEKSGIDPYKKVNEITREERKELINNLKAFELNIKALRGFDEAIITKGGVSVKEINPATMMSRRVKGLRFIGEVLDLDALTGGFNLQIAWSTAAQVE